MSKKDIDESPTPGTENETEKSGNVSSAKANVEKPEVKPEEKKELVMPDLQKQLEELNIKHRELNDKHLRLYSEFDNFRKRTLKERIELIKSAGEDVISVLLPVLDDFERAIKFDENSEDIKAVKEGIKLVQQKMKNILSQQGLKEMEIKEGNFDADLHDAITKIPSPDEKQKGKIVDVVEKGYYLNDKVIRHAKVVIGE